MSGCNWSYYYVLAGEVKIDTNPGFDREVIPRYTLNITVSDPTQTSAPEVLTVEIHDANEPPHWYPDRYEVTINEKEVLTFLY